MVPGVGSSEPGAQKYPPRALHWPEQLLLGRAAVAPWYPAGHRVQALEAAADQDLTGQATGAKDLPAHVCPAGQGSPLALAHPRGQ